MVDTLLVVETFLDREDIAHHREGDAAVSFELPFGRTSYACEIEVRGRTLKLSATCADIIAADHVEAAATLVRRFVNAGAATGQTFLNPRRGQLRHITSVDVGATDITVERVRVVLETLLDPFNVMVLALGYVLDGGMSAEAAVDCYAAWDRKRIDALMRGTVDDDVDPSLN